MSTATCSVRMVHEVQLVQHRPVVRFKSGLQHAVSWMLICIFIAQECGCSSFHTHCNKTFHGQFPNSCLDALGAIWFCVWFEAVFLCFNSHLSANTFDCNMQRKF